MALICPFRGYRYNQAVVGDLNLVVTQPYDKISPELQQDYYGRSAYNVVRITKSVEKNENPETDYPEAGGTLQSWLENRVLVQESSPAIYAYYREYEFEGEVKLHRGFIALLDIRQSGDGILPHERTMAEPKMDRLRLMRRIECNDDLIYALYTEDDMAINRVLEETTSITPAAIEVTDDFGVLHKVWPITNSRGLRRIQNAMLTEELFIADGHHRYETAVNYMKECEAGGWRPGATESFNKRMIACFNSADQGTTILPTHRLVKNLDEFDPRHLLSMAGQYFDAEPCQSQSVLWDKMKRGRGEHVFGFYAGRTLPCHLLKLKGERKADSLMLRHGEAYRHLDVSILHTLVLDRLLGIDEKRLVAQTNVDYARDRDACIRRVDEGRYQAAFFLNPTTVEQVQRVALLGERMPQKSTDFYPKLLSGLVFMKMVINR